MGLIRQLLAGTREERSLTLLVWDKAASVKDRTFEEHRQLREIQRVRRPRMRLRQLWGLRDIYLAVTRGKQQKEML